MPIPECDKIWINGEFVDWDDAKIHVLTHALHYGSGVFEGIRCYNTGKGPAVFRFKEHLERFLRSARMYHMNPPYTVKELADVTKQLIKVNELEECYIRPIMYRGYGEMGLNPLDSVVDTAVAVWEWGTYLGEEGLENGIETRISSYQRINSNVLPPAAKACGQYLNSILAKVEALQSDVDEAIMLDKRGFVSEGPGENLFMVKDEELLTPPLHASILPGITRNSVMEIASDMGYVVSEKDMDRGMLYNADELFFTGTAAEVTPIHEVDGHEIGKHGKVTKEIQEKFFEVVKGKDPEYEDWLDYV